MSKHAFSAGLILAFILAAAGAARAQGHVTDVAISVDPSSLQSQVCPVTLAFDGYITMDGPGTVTYQITRSDGAASSPYSVEFTKPGTYPLRETVLFEGELVAGERAVAIAPTLWEWDGDERQLLSFWGACAAARARLAASAIPIMTGPFPERYAGLGTALDGLITLPVTPEGDADRPIGISVAGSAGSYTPRVLLLTYEGASAAAGAASFGGDTYAINYRDPDGFDGDYTLFVKVELLP